MSDKPIVLSGEDARRFRYYMDYTDISSELVAHMARAIHPDIWAANDILERLRSLKIAKDGLDALLEFKGEQTVLRNLRKLRREGVV